MKVIMSLVVLLLLGCDSRYEKSQWDVWACEDGRAFYTHITDSGKAEALIYDEKVTEIVVHGDRWTFESAEVPGNVGTIVFKSQQAILTNKNIVRSPPVIEWSYTCSFSRKIEL